MYVKMFTIFLKSLHKEFSMGIYSERTPEFEISANFIYTLDKSSIRKELDVLRLESMKSIMMEKLNIINKAPEYSEKKALLAKATLYIDEIDKRINEISHKEILSTSPKRPEILKTHPLPIDEGKPPLELRVTNLTYEKKIHLIEKELVRLDNLDKNKYTFKDYITLYYMKIKLNDIIKTNKTDIKKNKTCITLINIINSKIESANIKTKSTAEKYAILSSLEDKDISKIKQSELKTLYILKQGLKKFTEDLEELPNFKERAQRLKSEVDRKIEAADAQSKLNLFPDYVRFFEKELNGKWNKIENNLIDSITKILESNASIEEKSKTRSLNANEVITYINSIEKQLKNINIQMEALTKIGSSERKAFDIMYDNELPLKEFYTGNELALFKRELQDIVDIGRELRGSAVKWYEEVNPEFRNLSKRKAISPVKLEFKNNLITGSVEIKSPDELKKLNEACKSYLSTLEKVRVNSGIVADMFSAMQSDNPSEKPLLKRKT